MMLLSPHTFLETAALQQKELVTMVPPLLKPTVTDDCNSLHPSSLSHKGEGADGVETASIDSFQSVHPPAFNAGPRRGPLLPKGLAAAILVPLLVVFAITFFCMRLHRREGGVGIQQRRLAEGGEEGQESDEEELEDLLAECLEKHSKLLTEPEGTEPGERASKRLRLEVTVQDLFHRALHPSEAPAQTPVEAESEPAAAADEKEQESQKPAEFTIFRPWLTPPHKSSAPAPPVPAPSYPSGVHAEPPRTLWDKPLPDPKSSSAEATREASERGLESALEGPSTSAAAPAISQALSGQTDIPTPPWNPREHPFTRLPRRAPGAVTRKFIPGGSFHKDFSGKFSSSFLMNVIRELLKEETLDSDELGLLMRTTESLVHVVATRATLKPPCSIRPAHILSRLAWYFLVYDSIVSAKEVLGPSMPLEDWWFAFTNLHETEYNLRPHYGSDTKSYRVVLHHIYLVNGLSRALSYYKRGIRPPKLMIYTLKKALLCDPDSPKRIAERYGFHYQKDHLEFLAANPDFKEDFGPEDA
ncbi:hypothetical protein Emed_004047 [Eimeria media]